MLVALKKEVRKINTLIRAIIYQYREIIKRDGRVEDADLKEMLILDDGIADEYKTDESLKKLITVINKPFTDTKQNKLFHAIKPLYEKGMLSSEIAQKLGITYHQVYYALKRKGLISNDQKILNDKYSKIHKLYKLGLTDSKIASELNISESTVYKYREMNNLPSNFVPKDYRSKKIKTGGNHD